MKQLLQHVTDTKDLEEALKKFKEKHKWAHLHQAVLFHLTDAFPESKLFLYTCQINSTKYWYAYKKNTYVKAHLLTCCDGIFRTKDFLAGFQELSGILNLYSGKYFVCVATKEFTDAISSYTETLGGPAIAAGNPCQFFYMLDEQREMVKRMELPKLPDGYELGSSNPDTDFEIITKTWRYAREGEVDQTRAKLTCFPSSCIRYNGVPVSFEMYDHLGHLNHQYTFEEHRRKGLGTIVELDICKKIIDRGYILFKSVSMHNPEVIASSQKSKIWTRIMQEDGSELFMVYMDVKVL